VDAVSNFVTALAVGWFVTAAVIVGVYLWRYARAMAELRRQEQVYADLWCQQHRANNRYLHADDRSPE
jgi:uncharacterized membrane protein (DUF485 family)